MTLLQRFLRLPPPERAAVIEAACLLSLARVALLAVPFRLLARWMGRPAAGEAGEATLEPADAVLVSKAIDIATRHLPWDSRCFAQALAAAAMLRRRRVGVTTFLGVARSGDGSLKAHAWTRCGGVLVTGGGGLERYQVIAAFESGRSSPP